MTGLDMTQPPRKAPRADAVRNRAKILDAARQQITVHGPGVGVDEIAAAAGVATGTLYGHFPTKDHLVAAVVSGFLTQVADRSETAVTAVHDGGAHAFDELVALLRDVVSATALNRGAKAAASGGLAGEGDEHEMQRARLAMQFLIDRARSEESVREDLTIDDVYLLVSSVPEAQPAHLLDRWVELFLFGITRQASERS